jgi:hypothetical protein
MITGFFAKVFVPAFEAKMERGWETVFPQGLWNTCGYCCGIFTKIDMRKNPDPPRLNFSPRPNIVPKI